MTEMLKKVPLPIWIGLALVLIVIVLMNRGGSSSQKSQQTTTAPVGPVTTATVGTQGVQSNAGTDQELGNLSVMTQSGFSQIANQNKEIISSLGGGMNGVGPSMQQMGNSIQLLQNQAAAQNAANGTIGQNAGSNPSTVTTNQ